MDLSSTNPSRLSKLIHTYITNKQLIVIRISTSHQSLVSSFHNRYSFSTTTVPTRFLLSPPVEQLVYTPQIQSPYTPRPRRMLFLAKSFPPISASPPFYPRFSPSAFPSEHDSLELRSLSNPLYFTSTMSSREHHMGHAQFGYDGVGTKHSAIFQ